MSDFHVQQAIRALNRGGVVAYPTEAVFGLGCYPEDWYAVAKILLLKCRSLYKGLIVVAADAEQIEHYVEYPDHSTKQKVLKTWPGAVTWLLPAKATVPYWVSGYRHTVAIRVSAHPLVQRLCASIGPIISTSANPEGLPPATNITKVRSYFGNTIDYIVPGETGDRCRPTEIRDAITAQIVRFGDDTSIM